MNRIPVVSSNIKSIGHDVNTQTLEVEFNGNSIYHYVDVPQEVYTILLTAESVGKALNAFVKGKYNYVKID